MGVEVSPHCPFPDICRELAELMNTNPDTITGDSPVSQRFERAMDDLQEETLPHIARCMGKGACVMNPQMDQLGHLDAMTRNHIVVLAWCTKSLAELNRSLQTPEGRAAMRAAAKMDGCDNPQFI